MKRISKYLFLSVFMLFCHSGYSQIVRGADTSEIYLHCFWYASNLRYFNTILRSVDNGKEFSVQYSYDTHGSEASPKLTGDSLSGTLLLDYVGTDSLKVSIDYGETYQPVFVFPRKQWLVGGCMSGEFYYKSGDVDHPGLYRVTGFGSSITLMNDNFAPNYLMEVGAVPGEVYSVIWPMIWDTIALGYSSDFGQTFTTSLIETSGIPGLGGFQIFSGTEPEEFYLVRMDMDYRYYIFHTWDNGQTLDLKHITQPFMHPSGWHDMNTFTTGRTPGSFYHAYCTIDSGAFLDPHTKIWLYYSNDYAQTFTTYFHDLDSTYTGIQSRPLHKEGFRTYPNPVSTQLTVELPDHGDVATIQLLDLTGRQQLITRIPPGKKKDLLDVSGIKPGIYLLKVTAKERMIGVEKIVVQ